MRIGNRAVAENPNGLALDGTALGLMNMAGLITPKTLDTKGSIAFEQGMAQYMTAIETARGFVWVTSETNTRSEQIAVGRDWVRMHLTAQKIGLSFHPLSQALQEFPEMAGPYRETQAETWRLCARRRSGCWAASVMQSFPAPLRAGLCRLV